MNGLGGTVRRLVAMAVISASFALAVPAGVGAQTVGQDVFDCDAAVVDEAGVLDTAALAAQISTVSEANVVVRSFESVADGDLPAAVDEVIAACFVDDDGIIAPDLALFSLSLVDRSTDVFLGSSLPGGSIPDELADAMAAEFPDDFTGGVSIAIAELADRFGGSSAPSDTESDTGRGVAVDDGGSSGGLPSGVLAGSALAVAAGAGGVALARRRRTLTTGRNELAAAVMGPRNRVGLVREQTVRLESQAELWGRIASGTTLEALHGARRKARDSATETERLSALLSGATPDGIGDASTEQVFKATERLDELRGALDRHETSLDELFALGARLDHLRVALPAKKELLLRELAASEDLVVVRRGEGWQVTEVERQLASIRATLDATDLNDFALDLLALSDRVEEAEARLFATDHELQSLPDRPGALEAWRTKQREAAELERRRAGQVRDTVTALAAVHSPDSWQWAADYPAQALQLLTEADRVGDEAMELSAGQQFARAGQGLEQAGLRLIAADDFLDQVDDLVIDLEQAKIEAPGILAESRQVADQFGTYVERYRGDLDAGLVAKPQFLDDVFTGLEAELHQPLPNYLRVAQTADRLNRELDDLLAQAEEQHQRMEALRRQAEREVARAVRSIRRAKESLGWQLFASRQARELEALETALGSLPNEPVARFQAAQDLADRATAVQERIIADRRRGGNWVIVGGGGSGPWGSGTSTGGTGGGRSFGGGGAGRSFGGGGGGHSFGGGRGTGSW